MLGLRRQLILIHRQVVDDAVLLIGSLAAASFMLLALALLAFIYPTNQMLHMAYAFLILPFLMGMGMFLLGATQSRGNDDQDVIGTLSITAAQLALARVVTGFFFVGIVVGCIAMAVFGAAIAGLIEWPESLFPQGLLDLGVSLLLVGLACHSLGFLAGRRATGLIATVPLLPLVAIVVSLIVVRGIGTPLWAVLVPFVVALLAFLVTFESRSPFAWIALGFVSLTVAAVSIWWPRYFSDVTTTRAMLAASDEVEIRCYGRLDRKTKDRWDASGFTVHGRLHSPSFPASQGQPHFLLQPVGLISYLQAKEPDGDTISLHHFGSYYGLFYSEPEGLFVSHNSRSTFYAGPEGMDTSPNRRLGRFQDPVICERPWEGFVVWDRQRRCFYRIDFRTRDVQSLEITDATLEPIDTISSRLGRGVCSLSSSLRDEDEAYMEDNADVYLPLVDQSGAISVMDRRDLSLLRGVGHLPPPCTFFGTGSSCPRDLFDYDIGVIVKRPKKEYAGLMVGSLARQGAPMTIAVFDKDGHLVEGPHGDVGFRPPVLLTMKYLIESLHPPILTLASFFTAYAFDAGASHRSLFLMPNSFVALQRDRETSGMFQLLWALVFLLPAVFFSGLLAWRVIRDATLLGLSRRAKVLWLATTLAFGLPAYVTYRLTRPRAVMTLCRECGHERRVDRDVCHHCGGGWNAPTLDAPTWRVVTS